MFDAKTLDDFSSTVESIYLAALEPDRWPTVMQQVADLHHSEKALLFTPLVAPHDGGFAFPHGISERAMVDWATRYIHQDVWIAEWMRREMAAGEVVCDSDLISDRELLASPFFREFLVEYNIRYLCSGMVFDGRSAGPPMTGCSVYGPPSSGGFDNRSRQLHRLTLNHLSRGLGTMLRLRDAELRLASTHAALDRLASGVMLLGARGQVVFANQAARRMLGAADGLSMKASLVAGGGEGTLFAHHPQAQQDVAQSIHDALRPDPLRVAHFSQATKLPRSHGRHWVLQVAPLGDGSQLAWADRHAHAIAFLSEPGAACTIDATTLARLYHATPAEARLAQMLLDGDGLPEAADKLGVAHSTVRSQLRSLFGKTNTHRQADLVRLLMSIGEPTARR